MYLDNHFLSLIVFAMVVILKREEHWDALHTGVICLRDNVPSKLLQILFHWYSGSSYWKVAFSSLFVVVLFLSFTFKLLVLFWNCMHVCKMSKQ